MDAVISLFSFKTHQFMFGYGWVLIDGFVKKGGQSSYKRDNKREGVLTEAFRLIYDPCRPTVQLTELIAHLKTVRQRPLYSDQYSNINTSVVSENTP